MPYYYRNAWLTYRHDEYGTGLQLRPGEVSGDEPVVGEESFICYPNPAAGISFRVRLDISGRADVTVRIFNLEGEEVFRTADVHDWEGEVPFEKEIPTEGLASGIYLCHVSVTGDKGEWSGAKKVAIVR
jgi:hypothetical protein